MLIQGWGRYPSKLAEYCEPAGLDELRKQIASLESPAIVRGAGRSYGDSALADSVISSRYLDNFVSFDEKSGILKCGAGLTIDQILTVIVPKGWFLPVVPGTKFVSVGGAIASDIHGKNHHCDGCFSEHLKSIKLLTAQGEVISCSKTRNKKYFYATCGGMGLTGIVVEASLQLKKITSPLISQRSIRTVNLEESLEQLENHENNLYSVAWLDCIAKGEQTGRSVIFLGNHIETENNKASELTAESKLLKLDTPFNSPAFMLNRWSIGLFNSAYYKLKGKESNRNIHCDSYFFPLDRINNWNRLYGSHGFLQYQFVIPTETAKIGIGEVMNQVTASGKGSFLSVLKKFGAANKNYLSFPTDGYTLALDFKFEKSLLPLLNKLDEIILHHGGRLYLAKDARMSEHTFKQGYTHWDKFLSVKNELDPDGVFSSLQSKRLGL
jgi:FAD/FMN-containing dehydrogenase